MQLQPVWRLFFAALLFQNLFVYSASAQDIFPSASPGGINSMSALHDPAEKDPQISPGSDFTASFFPLGDLYPQYMADPHSVNFSFQYLNFTRKTIPEAGDKRFNIKLGGRLGLVRFYPAGKDRAFQLNIEGGFNGLFDLDHSLDNIGWDGKYGFLLTTARERGPGFKFGTLHTSSHVGDEYAEKTGRRRIGYTRNELVGAVTLPVHEHWRTYAEAGRAYNMRNELQKPWRLQFGLEYESRKMPLSADAGWYAAFDASAMEERDWKIDTSLQAGVVIHSGERRWRFGIERYNGRSPIGEFFQHTESYIALGLWIDI